MKYQDELKKAEELVTQGKNLEAAKIYEDIGTKSLREGGTEEKAAAPKIIAKSIARYLLAGNSVKAKDLAYQVLFMKDEDPFLSLQIETAISSKKYLMRLFYLNKIPKKITSDLDVLNGIPENNKVLKINSEVTIKNMWESTIFGDFENKYDLLDQKLINYIQATRTGVTVLAVEALTGEKFLAVLASTFNEDPLEVIEPK
ncbi:MAG: hypothetical protein ACTSPK_06270 [Candidatus Heimdallarchaeota archaeon]